MMQIYAPYLLKDHHPQQQGLRRLLLNLVDGVSTLLKDHHPQQQGLRPLEEIPQSTLLPLLELISF